MWAHGLRQLAENTTMNHKNALLMLHTSKTTRLTEVLHAVIQSKDLCSTHRKICKLPNICSTKTLWWMTWPCFGLLHHQSVCFTASLNTEEFILFHHWWTQDVWQTGVKIVKRALITSAQKVIGHFTTFCPLKGHPRRRFIMCRLP